MSGSSEGKFVKKSDAVENASLITESTKGAAEPNERRQE
jgi:hypothetical protein